MGEFIFELDEDMAKDLLIKVLATSKIPFLKNLFKHISSFKFKDNKIFDTTNAQSSIRKRVMEAMDSDADITSIEYVPTSGRNKGKVTSLYYKGAKRRLFTWLSDIYSTITLIKKETFLSQMGRNPRC